MAGELTLAYEGLEMAAEPGLDLSICTAGSPSDEWLRLLAPWAATREAGTSATEETAL